MKKDVNQIDLPLFLRQFTCKKTIEKIKLADIPYNNNSFIYTNPGHSKTIQNRSGAAAHANNQRNSSNEPSVEIKVNLNSSPESPKQDVSEQTVPEHRPDQQLPTEPIERTANEKSSNEQGLVYCFLFFESLMRIFNPINKTFDSDNSMGSEIENQMMLEAQEKRKFFEKFVTI